MRKKIALTICSIFILSGCYTEFAVIRREPPPPQVSYEVDSVGDTVKVLHTSDTMVKERENCYWTRNMWGQPEWRCGGSNFSNSWYQYNDYPWWYSSYPYYYDLNGRCPQYYYYDASCSSCRRYDEGGYYQSNYNRGNYSRGGGNISPAPASGASVTHRLRVNPVANQSTVAPSSSSPNSYQGSGIPKVEAPSGNAPANVNPGPSAPAEQPAGNMQSSPPPSSSSPPPSNNDGGSGNNEQKHRNPRSR